MLFQLQKFENLNKKGLEMAEHTHEKTDRANFGFWIYLMTDLLMFAVLFAAFIVLRDNTFGGPGGSELFDLNYVLAETIILLLSSFTCGLATIALHRNRIKQVFLWFGVTFVLGAGFLTMELVEFSRLIAEGHSYQANAFLSAYFSLVGTHGLHIAVGLFWMAVALIVLYVRGINPEDRGKLNRLAMFWHFLDLVWIFIFSIVYLIGVVR